MAYKRLPAKRSPEEIADLARELVADRVYSSNSVPPSLVASNIAASFDVANNVENVFINQTTYPGLNYSVTVRARRAIFAVRPILAGSWRVFLKVRRNSGHGHFRRAAV